MNTIRRRELQRAVNPRVDNYDMMTRIVFGDVMDPKIFKAARDRCKIIYLGLCYGEGGE